MHGLLAACLMGLGPPAPGDSLEPFELRQLGSSQFTWQPGRVTVLTVVAYWCDTWKTQFKRLDTVSRSLKGLPVDQIAVSIDGRWTDLSRDGKWGVQLEDKGRTWTGPLGIDRVPYTFVVDASGTIRYAVFGIVRSEEVIRAAREAVALPAEKGTVALTFDDFPQPGDKELLDVLSQEDVPATFFCIGSRVAGAQELVRRAAYEGHSLEVHSWAHSAAKPELERCANGLAELVGVRPRLYRAPGSRQVLDFGFKPVGPLAVAPFDFQRPSALEISRRTLLQVRPGCVVQLHSGVQETVEALPTIIGNLKRRGYTFVTLR